MSHYDTLGVPNDADAETIKRAYRRKRSEAHPDRHGGDHQAMVAVNRAHDTLSDPEKRARYDQTGEDGPAQPAPDKKARELLIQLFSECFDRLPDTIDPLPVIRKSICDMQDKVRGEIQKLKAIADRLENKRKRIRYRGKESNIVADMVDRRIADAKAKTVEYESVIEVSNLALKLADDFEFEVEAQQDIMAFYTGLVTSGSGS